MSTQQPDNSLKMAYNWFGRLSKSATAVKKSFARANRKTVKAESELIDAIVLALQAHNEAYELIGEKADDSITIVAPSNKDAHHELWASWCDELFDVAYTVFTKQVEHDVENNKDN